MLRRKASGRNLERRLRCAPGSARRASCTQEGVGYPARQPPGGRRVGESRMDAKLLDAARAAFPAHAKTLTLGAPLQRGECLPEPLVAIPLAMLNRHGLIAGATGTGKTKTLQLMAEQLCARGRPGFSRRHEGRSRGHRGGGRSERAGAARARGHRLRLARRALPGRVPEPHRQARRPAARDGVVVRPAAAREGARLERDADQRARAGLQVLRRPRPRAARLRRPARRARSTCSGEGAGELAELRRHVEGHGRRAAARDGGARAAGRAARSSASPSSTSTTCSRPSATGAASCRVLELADVQDKPALFSTFMMWMLARLYATLPEVGDARASRSSCSSSTKRTCCSTARASAFLDADRAGGAARSARRASASSS